MKLDFKTLIIPVVLPTVLSVTVSLAIFYFSQSKQPQIVSVDLKGILQEFVVSTAATKMEGDELSKHVQDYTKKLEELTKALAEQENFIIVPKNAVLAGGRDITAEVKGLLEQGYGNDKGN